MRAKLRWVDPMLPLFMAVLQVTTTWGAQWNQPDRVQVDAVGVALLVAGPLALAVRRHHPVLTLIATLAVTFVFIARGHAYGPIFFSPVIAFYNAVVLGHRRVVWAFSAAAYVFFVVYTTWLAPVPSPGLWHMFAIAAVIGVILALGEFVRARRERLAEHERVVQEEARRQASDERLTMAQELHDVLAHNISLIHVQASTALHLIDDQPEQARTALTTIKQASKDVLTEMRSVLSVLRDGAPRSPTAGMERLEELIERSGLPVTRRVTGQVRALPPGVDRAGYRIVQEALTNVTRHAPGSTAAVLLEYGPRELLIRVTDSGGGPPGESLGGGNGIPGMRERAAALGGSLTAERHGQGFRVEARLPIPEIPEGRE
ncbi:MULTISPECIES: sensor histidine kinase [Streptosporangium]|uniref:histidine kinase n=1 Tax=Streptosporangium brasiliense TaxID=47480 RepID=A0ABT9R050_9ACTN|nr:sensor histidine kinase [Streptosporangium brasiliense]MDP9862602.1 signal transduction histidine kinase [Streptosporangium brasiliense]